MELLDIYTEKAKQSGWNITLKGFIAFKEQVKLDWRKANGNWWWEK